MSLSRFADAAIDLGQVVAIRTEPSGPEPDPDGPPVRVFFKGSRSALFRGRAAKAVRDYLAGLDEGKSTPGDEPPRLQRTSQAVRRSRPGDVASGE